MTQAVRVHAIGHAKAWEYLVRFVFGGAVTACTGIVAHAYGPVVGGLFLGFPAILPAALTFVKSHDGRRAATADARGATLGGVGLVVFALIVWQAGRSWAPPLTLAVATAAWVALNAGLWAAILRG